MTSDDQFVTLASPVRFVSGLTFLLGLWLFASPWVFGAYYNANSWNSFIIGIVIGFIGAITFTSGRRFLVFRSLVGLLGVWCFASPWVYNYVDNTGRFVNSLSVGVALFVLAIID